MAKKISAAHATRKKVPHNTPKKTATASATSKALPAALPNAPAVNIKDEKISAAPAPKAPPVRDNSLFEEHPPVPSSFSVTASAVRIIAKYWRVFLGIALVYAAMNVLFIQGLHVASNVSNVQKTISQVPANRLGRLGDGISMVATLIGTGGNSVSPTSGPYQFVLTVVVSLAVIWLLREAFAGREFSLRDGFYRGMSPFVTFLLTGVLVIVQLVPFAIGSALYSIVVSNGLATNPLMQVVFIGAFLGLACISIYLLTSSLFSLYIVTLPGMTPWAASRTARDLVAHRRFTIMRKILFLPFLLLLACMVVLMPFVLWMPAAAPWAFTALAALLLVFAHSYIYTLYRALI